MSIFIDLTRHSCLPTEKKRKKTDNAQQEPDPQDVLQDKSPVLDLLDSQPQCSSDSDDETPAMG